MGETLLEIDGTVATAVTKELATKDWVPDVAGGVPEPFCKPVTAEERGEDDDPPLGVVGEILTKLTGTVVVDDGALLTVVGVTLNEVGVVDVNSDGVMLPPVKVVVLPEGVCRLPTTVVGTMLGWAVFETGVVPTVEAVVDAG